LAAALALVSACLAADGARADAAAGARLAQQWCVNCHVIDGAGPTATVPQGPPSFHTIAGHLNPDQLRAFLTHPHGAMPDLALTRAEIDNLVGYIQTMK
jgi:mono/diheme cytochrome c family protein